MVFGLFQDLTCCEGWHEDLICVHAEGLHGCTTLGPSMNLVVYLHTQVQFTIVSDEIILKAAVEGVPISFEAVSKLLIQL